jgi:hypothetical protein
LYDNHLTVMSSSGCTSTTEWCWHLTVDAKLRRK